MGMFDDVRCEYPLPGWPEGEDPAFQTKDLECLLIPYRITADGRLMEGRRGGEERDTGYHGMLSFYTYRGNRNDKTYEWWEYTAKFTDGRVVEITGGRE